MDKIRTKAVAKIPDTALKNKGLTKTDKTATNVGSLKGAVKASIKIPKNVDLRSVPREQKIKALKFYDNAKKTAKFAALIGFVSVTAFATGNVENLPTLSLQNNVLNIKLGSSTGDEITSARHSLTSLAADENALGIVDSSPLGNVEMKEISDGKFGGTGKLKQYYKKVNGSNGGFFVIPKGDVNKVIFPRLRDQYGEEFTAEEIKTFLENNGIKNADVQLEKSIEIFKSAIEEIGGTDQKDINEFFGRIGPKTGVMTYSKKDHKFTLSKSKFGDNYDYYSDFVDELNEIYSGKIKVVD